MNKGIRYVRTVMLLVLMLVLGAAFSGGKAEAASKYMIKINKQQNVVTVYKMKGGKYKAYKAFVCSAGYATPTGTFRLGEKMRWHTLDGPSYGQYCSRIVNGILFHSVWYYQPNQTTQSYVQYNRLGTTASHGCVRLTTADCKWIYDNVPSGSKVVIYRSKKPGPLGKPKAIKVRGYTGWDPTDPSSSNPYKKKKPTITVNKNTNVSYGSKFNVKKGVKVTNSTGFNAKSLLKTSILYKMDSKTKYKKVKKVNTKKPGKYKVTYKVKDEIKHTAKKTVVFKVLTKVSVGSITLNKKSATLYLGGQNAKNKFTLKVKKIKPSTATHKTVTFSSSNKAVVKVSKKGVVTALKAGSANIYAKATDGSGTIAVCRVTVIQYMTSIQMSAPATTLAVGNAMQIRATAVPADTSNKEVTYTSSDASVASVNASGSVRGLKPGTVTIQAKAKDGSGVVGSIRITVSYQYNKTTTMVGAKTVTYGTSWNDVLKVLPAKVTVADHYNKTAQATVKWTCASYKATTAGTYKATGIVTLPSGWTGKPATFTVNITVQAAPVISGGAVTGNK